MITHPVAARFYFYEPCGEICQPFANAGLKAKLKKA